MRQKVLVCARSFQKLDGEHKKILEDAGLEIVSSGLDRALSADELAERIRGMSAVIVGMDIVDETVFKAADMLKVVSMNGVGIDRIDIKAATRKGIVVTHTPGTNMDSVADHTMALILSCSRRIPYHDRMVRAGGWKRMVGRELRNQQLGLVGLGYIGKAVALRALSFGMRISAFDPCMDTQFCFEHAIQAGEFETILDSSDILSLHCALTLQTERFINARTIAKMKKGAILINTARGELVDQEDLIDALRSGRLGGAGLDVFETEPPQLSPLWEMDQVVLTPHLGGNTKEAALRTAYRSALNVVAVLTGGKAQSGVNQEVLAKNGK